LIDDSHNVDEMIRSFVLVLFSSIRVGTVDDAIMARAILVKEFISNSYEFGLLPLSPANTLHLITEYLIKTN